MKRIISMLAVVAMMATTAWAQAPVQDYVVLNGTNVRLRLEPNLQCEWLKDAKGAPTYLKKGTKLPYTGESGDFYQVNYEGRTLYVSKQFSFLNGKGAPVMQKEPQLKTDAQPTRKEEPGKTYVTLTGTGVRLRLGPGLDYDYLKNPDGTTASLPKGAKLEKRGETEDFYKCVHEGRVVYVSKKYAK